ncbi:hypothetical protein LOAG_09190 [Loa loa]|uniref:Uncharacterized protein n=1 Tax=Loa loa TaxID=7209 RepID=A0A1S0TSX4_LOALO|nr:hypothetical protein LOAG_09190 [Loa loa]EFO19305.1 hypothetical protein LOAG_09190 [Loa loa]
MTDLLLSNSIICPSLNHCQSLFYRQLHNIFKSLESKAEQKKDLRLAISFILCVLLPREKCQLEFLKKFERKDEALSTSHPEKWDSDLLLPYQFDNTSCTMLFRR